jgi:hypothetical protein
VVATLNAQITMNEKPQVKMMMMMMTMMNCKFGGDLIDLNEQQDSRKYLVVFSQNAFQ